MLLYKKIVAHDFRYVPRIKLDIEELCWEGADWTVLAQGVNNWLAIVKAVMNLRVP